MDSSEEDEDSGSSVMQTAEMQTDGSAEMQHMRTNEVSLIGSHAYAEKESESQMLSAYLQRVETRCHSYQAHNAQLRRSTTGIRKLVILASAEAQKLNASVAQHNQKAIDENIHKVIQKFIDGQSDSEDAC